MTSLYSSPPSPSARAHASALTGGELAFTAYRPQNGIFAYRGDCLSMEAQPQTNYFVNPDGSPADHTAPVAALVVEAPVFSLYARVSTRLGSLYDAAGLIVETGDPAGGSAGEWGKCVIELSPFLRPTIVSVVTREVSDDANGEELRTPEAHLRVHRNGPILAFHWSVNGAVWKLARLFSLKGMDGPLRAGMIVQAPMGDALTAVFSGICLETGVPIDLRNGE
ncbi:hypothetical protein ASC97_24615 [Rhizobium sp. Root1203]|uniref:DUF1349 domain-containing protein n=1 Tax=Rhizobium sp. Root1203 TaxID=1736427 RepID=UPI000710EABF|nr:DUF1349 domain-containing protein [Rhizobium sp. Root1203]KQV27113.1 hypothetical protein ASC97_24615 [Rhizobium sp. Root1203]